MTLEIDIKKQELGDDPPIVTYKVTLTNENGEWTERYTLRELEVFLRGVTVGSIMGRGDLITVPEIPR